MERVRVQKVLELVRLVLRVVELLRARHGLLDAAERVAAVEAAIGDEQGARREGREGAGGVPRAKNVGVYNVEHVHVDLGGGGGESRLFGGILLGFWFEEGKKGGGGVRKKKGERIKKVSPVFFLKKKLTMKTPGMEKARGCHSSPWPAPCRFCK